jgi:hypothetical protein
MAAYSAMPSQRLTDTRFRIAAPRNAISKPDTSRARARVTYRTEELLFLTYAAEFCRRGLLFLFQKKRAFFADQWLQRFRKFCQKPGKKHFELYEIVGHVDRAVGRLAERTHAKLQVIAGPDLLLDAEKMRKARSSTAETVLQTAKRLLLAEAMRNGDDERC